MILWMACSTVFALLVSLSARAAEVAARGYGRAVRGIWAGALVASGLLPVVVWITGVRWPGLLPWTGARASLELPSLVSDVSVAATSSALDAARTWNFPFDRMAQLLWVLLSLAALCWFCWAWQRLAQARASWRPHVLRDQRVLLSATSGPAVIGFYRPSIVVPRWVLSETASVQRMILLHEQEHAKSGDHVLLALAPLLLVALPWNLPLWWQAKRLRLAIELDCDARVLRHGICPREYGTLLLELAGAHGSAAVAGASLVEPRTFLERRIIAMSSQQTHRRHGRAAAGITGAILLGVAACESTTAMAPARAPEPAAATQAATTAEKATIVESGRGPLLIVDGVVVGRHNQITTPLERVEIGSVEVIKGQAARARYGADGSEGVIVVTTRRGTETPRAPLVIDEVGRTKKSVVVLEKADLGAKRITLREAGPGREKLPLIATTKPQPPELEVAETKRVPLTQGGISPETRLDAQPNVSGEKLRMTLPATGAQPLLFIDGREVSESAMRSLAVDRIDSIEVVKGTRATALYGERGRNGVILIRTKDGS